MMNLQNQLIYVYLVQLNLVRIILIDHIHLMYIVVIWYLVWLLVVKLKKRIGFVLQVEQQLLVELNPGKKRIRKMINKSIKWLLIGYYIDSAGLVLLLEIVLQIDQHITSIIKLCCCCYSVFQMNLIYMLLEWRYMNLIYWIDSGINLIVD